MTSVGALSEADAASRRRPVREGQLSAILDDHLLGGLAVGGTDFLDLLHHCHAVCNDLAEDDVLAIQVGSLLCAEEELRTIGTRAGVGHGEDAFSGVVQLEVLVLELLPKDGLAASTIVVGEIATLAHEARNDT